MALYTNPVPQYLDSAGKPYVDGKLYYYVSGSNTPQETYADANLSIANANPVPLQADGRVPKIFLKPAVYNVVLTGTDSVSGELVQAWQRDSVGAEKADGAFGVWNSLTLYGQNDIVQGADGNFYISISNDNQNNDPVSSPAYWTQIKFNRVWNSNETYNTNAIVQGSDGFIYVSITDGNLNNNPVTDSVNWKASSKIDVPNVILASAKTFAYNNF